MATAAGLDDDEAVRQAYLDILGPAEELLFDKVARIAKVLMVKAGVDIGDEAAEVAASQSDLMLDGLTLPAELRNMSAKEAKEALANRIYGLSREEIAANPEILKNADSIVVVSEDGRKLEVISGIGIASATEDLPSGQTTLAANLSGRLLLAKTGEFQKRDIDDAFTPPGGFSSMSKVFTRLNSVLTAELGIPEVYSGNKKEKSMARYWATGKVIFVSHDALLPTTDGSDAAS